MNANRHALRCQACGSFMPAAGAHACKTQGAQPGAQQRPAPVVQFWTPERTARLEELTAAGMSRGEIAMDLSCSREAVKGKLRRLGIQPPVPPPVVPFAGGSTFWTDERIARMTDAYTTGASTHEIARELGCTRNSVIGKLHRLGIYRPLGTPPKPKPRPPKPPAPPPLRYRMAFDKRSAEHRGSAKIAMAIVKRTFEPPAALVADAPQPIPPTVVSIFELTGMTCRWPLWGMEITPVSEQFYCGAESVMPCRYCHAHSQIAFSRGR